MSLTVSDVCVTPTFGRAISFGNSSGGTRVLSNNNVGPNVKRSINTDVTHAAGVIGWAALIILAASGIISGGIKEYNSRREAKANTEQLRLNSAVQNGNTADYNANIKE